MDQPCGSAPWRPRKPEPSPGGVLRRRKLIVHVYAQCWNEAEMLPFFFRHYDGLVDQYFIYDDGSDDGSSELLSIHPKVDAQQVPAHRSRLLRAFGADVLERLLEGESRYRRLGHRHRRRRAIGT